jgi:flagellar hook-associated protein 1 FlgK
MAGLVTALNAARTSLEVNQKSIEVVGNNISNVNTEGYSRQKTTLTPYPAMNFGDFFIGQGVKVTDVKREHDVFVTNQLQDKSIDYGLYNGKSRSLSELERVFNITEENIATEVDRFFDSWQELSASPSDLVLRDIVIQRGQILATEFNNTVNDLNTVKENINDTIISKVVDINAKINEIADLNDRIYSIEIQGQTANSARDRRDMLSRELAESLGVKTYEDNRGMLAVQLPGGLPLVQGNQPMSIAAVTSGGSLQLQLHAGGTVRDIGLNNLGGEFEGLVEMRDSFIPALQEDLDRLAYEISTQVNLQHAAGAGLDSVTGRNFFLNPPNLGAGPPAEYVDAARNMAVALTDSNHVAAAQAPTPPATVAPGDNRNALLLSSIGETYLINGSDTFNAYYGKMTSRVGIEANQNTLSLQGSEDAVVQLQNMRDGLSGVSLEEEMVELIIYQRGFESSAKFLSTVDELMQSLINMR